MMRGSVLIVAVLATLASCGEAYNVKSSHGSPSATQRDVCGGSERSVTRSNPPSRRTFLGRVVSSAAASSALSPLLLHGSPARADVTNKVASSASLRLLKRALREIENLEMAASSDDYEGVRNGLRTPPFTEVRKNCMVLVRGGEDGSDADALRKTYSAFTRAVEDLDSQAGLGLRGKKGVSLIGPYDNTVKGLAGFLEVAERSAAVPIAQPAAEDQ
mmetsp:Transcript_20488/g.59382  ORF Transcript_20488/g.59382 Transcript_20488/m.59382 type:complete len:217 (-) Transcript_20488:286-936(-)|eukprot:CAMPEP_0113532150 /NCGR_PEP_ID=MMETSP0015_2-20120614/3894_1 /TAXON_ID=2838 /ORGANISM="Odontella" /LENGTH=216 /DNA_ID=CAMNT_0000431069 /DNA_START=57 /DNA_END=707 /DNA_ORIENTATION=+ /assembly_acc=CAM_ASM_000160